MMTGSFQGTRTMPAAGHQVVLDVLAVDGAMLAVDPDKVKAAAGDHLRDEGAVEAHMGTQRQLAGGYLVSDLVCVIHGNSSFTVKI